MKIHQLTALLLSALLSASAQAEWVLDSGKSALHFVSVKNQLIAETHRFDRFDGELSDSGQFTLNIDLASLNTMIDIRNERMREMLFEIASFPRATVTAQVDTALLNSDSSLQAAETALTLDLHGQSATSNALLTVLRLNADTLVVTTRAPIIIRANRFDLQQGVEKLRAVAGLESISPLVPVTATLVFTRQ